MTRWTTQAIDDALEAIRGATEGPWEADPIDDIHPESNVIKGGTWIALEVRNPDAEFLCRARGNPATGTGYEAALLALGRVVALEAKCRAMSTTLLDGTVEQRMCESFARSLRCALEGDDDDR